MTDELATSPSSQRRKMNPRANAFILVNLGCEMLYVIDQRLKAQQIETKKAVRVIHDVTTVLLEPKFIDSLINGSTNANAQLLTASHCKFMLNDIATCSIMRLDEISMDKLWNLMTVIYKWQLFVSQHQHHLLDITFRHLDAINKLYPDTKRHMLIDFTKNTLLDFWNSCGEEEQLAIFHTNKAWLECFNTKISLLIRLGFQMDDASFLRDVDRSYFQDFVQTTGENIYIKASELAEQQALTLTSTSTTTPSSTHVNQLAELLNFNTSTGGTGGDDLKPIDAKQFQKQYEANLQQCNILFEDLDMNVRGKTRKDDTSNTLSDANLFGCQFVQLQSSTPSDASGNAASPLSMGNQCGTGAAGGLNKQLLDLYSKMN